MRKHLPILSKSRYLYGIQCDKRLYLDCFRPDLLGEDSDALGFVFAQGHEVGALATQRYPGGVHVEYDRAHFAEASQATSQGDG